MSDDTTWKRKTRFKLWYRMQPIGSRLGGPAALRIIVMNAVGRDIWGETRKDGLYMYKVFTPDMLVEYAAAKGFTVGAKCDIKNVQAMCRDRDCIGFLVDVGGGHWVAVLVRNNYYVLLDPADSARCQRIVDGASHEHSISNLLGRYEEILGIYGVYYRQPAPPSLAPLPESRDVVQSDTTHFWYWLVIAALIISIPLQLWIITKQG